MSEIMRLWRNAIEIQAGRQGGATSSDAGQVIKALHKEWERRRRRPPSPDEYFRWPDTNAEIGSGSLSTGGWLKEGLLRFMGYQVGSTNGVATPVRRRMLEGIFEGGLPPVFEPAYLEKWGGPESPMRLQQMAETIAAFVRNAKRRLHPNYMTAIRDWESDLTFLYEQYYVDRFHFAWPTVALA
ncbi:MAG: hypothetical protein K5872_13460 [Rhizobiaceae bacterium]|nr:hypothetical protein [Rhizobiaceae bacterium]MCV0407227.1 hypothetical protein [Rhizobiaceae bacterium]